MCCLRTQPIVSANFITKIPSLAITSAPKLQYHAATSNTARALMAAVNLAEYVSTRTGKGCRTHLVRFWRPNSRRDNLLKVKFYELEACRCSSMRHTRLLAWVLWAWPTCLPSVASARMKHCASTLHCKSTPKHVSITAACMNPPCWPKNGPPRLKWL